MWEGMRLASFSSGTDDTVGDHGTRFLQGHVDSSSGVELLALGADCKGDAGLDSRLTWAEPGQSWQNQQKTCNPS